VANFGPATRTLSQNNLNGTIPESLGSLPNLINVYANYFSMLFVFLLISTFHHHFTIWCIVQTSLL